MGCEEIYGVGMKMSDVVAARADGTGLLKSSFIQWNETKQDVRECEAVEGAGGCQEQKVVSRVISDVAVELG